MQNWMQSKCGTNSQIPPQHPVQTPGVWHRPLLSETGGGGGGKVALPGFWLTHPPTLRPTPPPAGYPEGGGGHRAITG